MQRQLQIALLAGAAVISACKEEALTPRPCDPGDLECLEDPDRRRVRVCNEWGSAWVETTCPERQICIPGECDDPDACPDDCVPVVCEPGERFCGKDHVFLYECNDLGTSGCFYASCAAPPLDGVCFDGKCVSVCGAGQKSYIGCEYFAVDLDNAFVDCDGQPGGLFCDASAQQYSVVASNPDPDRMATVIVTKGPLPEAPVVDHCIRYGSEELPLPENFVAAEPLPPKGIVVFDLPARNVNGTVLGQLAYRVASNIPITVYQFNPLENVEVFSNDASMLMPTTAADTEYYAMNRAQFHDRLRGFVTVVGIADEPTRVAITTTANIYPGACEANTGCGVETPLLAGETREFVLTRFDVLNLEPFETGADLTGTHIVADRPVIVYAGNEAANSPTLTIPCVGGFCEDDPDQECESDTDCGVQLFCCSDHLEQQLFPISTWGREYIAVRSYPRPDPSSAGPPDVWRILASEDDTVVTLDPPVAVIPSLRAGGWHEFLAEPDFLISANKPIMVGQFLTGEHFRAAGIGDPAFMLAVPTRQFRDSYVFLAPGTSQPDSIGYAEDYVSIAVKTGSEARLDGQDIRQLALASPYFATLTPIAGGEWSAFRTPIDDGFHNLICPETCSVMVHGYDRYVSYGYPGGLNLLECTTDEDCKYPRLICTEEHVCVECREDEDCPDTKPHCNTTEAQCQL